VQPMVSSQTLAVCWHAPSVVLHTAVVHMSGSAHTFATFKQFPVAPSHESSVHGLLSSQVFSVRTQPLTGWQTAVKQRFAAVQDVLRAVGDVAQLEVVPEPVQ
jgi:hypothetical protein